MTSAPIKRNSSQSPRLEWLWWIVGLVLAFIASVYIAEGAVRMLYQMGVLDVVNDTVLVLTQRVLVYVLTVAIILIVARFLGKKLAFDSVGLSRLPDWRDIGLSALGMVGYLILTTILLKIAEQVPGFDANQTQDIGLDKLFSLDLMMAFGVFVIITPFFEELIFRGITQGALRRARLSAWVAVLVVSVLFGVAHGQWNVAIDAFALGIVAGVLREKTDAIWAGFLLHAIKNSIAFYALFVIV